MYVRLILVWREKERTKDENCGSLLGIRTVDGMENAGTRDLCVEWNG